MKTKLTLLILWITTISFAQTEVSKMLREIAIAPSTEHIEKDIRKLVSFGTRHTLSDTLSQTRGIGAARRWIKSEFENISKRCNNCLEVSYQRNLVPKNDRRIIKDTWVVNVLAI